MGYWGNSKIKNMFRVFRHLLLVNVEEKEANKRFSLRSENFIIPASPGSFFFILGPLRYYNGQFKLKNWSSTQLFLI